MTDEEKKKIIEKIQKLLRLKDKTTSEGEAYVAACGVHRLLTMYNLSLEDIPEKYTEQHAGLKVKKTDLFSYSSVYGTWKRKLLVTICYYNYCRCLVNTYSKNMCIVGEEQNVAVVKQLFDYLSSAFIRLAGERYLPMKIDEIRSIARVMGVTLDHAKKCYIVQLRKKNFFKSYLSGVIIGLDEQFEAMQPASDEKALIVTHKQAIDDFLKLDANYTGRDILNRHSDDDKDMEALEVGYNDGRSISLYRQIGRQENTKITWKREPLSNL